MFLICVQKKKKLQMESRHKRTNKANTSSRRMLERKFLMKGKIMIVKMRLELTKNAKLNMVGLIYTVYNNVSE